jgi:deoxycytidine triphosphate deaminase
MLKYVKAVKDRILGRSLLSYVELVELVDRGVIIAPLSSVKGSSIDVRLHKVIYREKIGANMGKIRLIKGESIGLEKVIMGDDGYAMMPDSIVLGATMELFNLPDNLSAEFSLKSSTGRNFIGHQLSGWVDATFCGSITLELKNDTQFHKIIIDAGLPIGQVKVFRHRRVPKEQCYQNKGQYMGQIEARPAGVIK